MAHGGHDGYGDEGFMSVPGSPLMDSNTDPLVQAQIQEPTVPPGHCSLCEGLFRRPRKLPCGHNFCDPCIRADVAGYPRWMRQDRVFMCPTCSEKYQMPERGVDGLQVSHDVQSVEYIMGDEYCTKHDKVRSYHCSECNRTVCPTCYNEDHRDKGHGISKHKPEVVRKKAAIQSALRDLNTRVDKINQYRKRLEVTNDRIAKDAANEHSEIDATVNFLIEHLQDKADSLKRLVSGTAEAERREITKSVEGLKKITADFEEVRSKAKQLALHGNDEDVEAEADDLLSQLTKEWCPSVPLSLVRTSWKTKRVDLNRLEYDSPQLGTAIDEVERLKFQYDILSYSGAAVTANESNNFTSGFDEWNRTQFCTADGGFVFMSGKVGKIWKICQFDRSGTQIWETQALDLQDKDVPKPCGLQVVTLGDKQFLASSSASKRCILFYDINEEKPSPITGYCDQMLCFNQMSILPPSTLLTLGAEQNKERKVLYLRQNAKSKPYKMQKTFVMDTHMDEAYGICVVSTNLTADGNLIILSSWKREGAIKAFKLNGEPIWEARGVIGGLPCNPHGVCADRRGHIYLADGKNKRVIVLNAEDGKFIQTLLTNEQHGIGLVYSVGWSEMRDQRFLIVNHKSDKHQQITTFKIGYQVKLDG